MPKRGPTDTDSPTAPVVNGEYEVVNAAGERKAASLLQRGKARIRDLTSMTDEQSDPAWPDELADPCPEGGSTMQCSLPKGHNGLHDYRPRPELADDQTIVTGNSGVAVPEETPPPKVMRELRRHHAAETEQRVGMAAAKVAGLVEIDRWMRLYAVNLQHLASVAGLIQEAVEAMQPDNHGARNFPTAELRAKFRAQIDEWDRDIEVSGS